MFVPLPFEFEKIFILVEYWWNYFWFFFPSLALVQRPCRLMGFLLILKELSHGGKNLSYVYYVVAFAQWLRISQKLKSAWRLLNDWMKNVSLKFKAIIWTRGPWTPTLDRVHGPPVMNRAHAAPVMTKTEIVQKIKERLSSTRGYVV